MKFRNLQSTNLIGPMVTAMVQALAIVIEE